MPQPRETRDPIPMKNFRLLIPIEQLRIWSRIVLFALSVALPSYAHAIDLQDYMQMRGPEPTRIFAYGPAPSQVVEFFRPQGEGPFPVVVLIHGGCWVSRYQGLPQFRALADVLAKQGVAVWNVGYRGVDEPGGGFPGTYLDITAALSELDTHAASLRLDRDRIIAVGHSAGAQLALWAAARHRIPSDSPLHVDAPQNIVEVIALGALADLRDDASAIEHSCGISVSSLTGSASAARPHVFADTSPIDMVPFDAKVVLVNGEHDEIAPPALEKHFADTARQAGMDVTTMTLPGAGHFDEVTPGTPTWDRINAVILRAIDASPVHR